MDRLRSSWTELLIECGADPGTPDRVFDDVAARYSEPDRAYHTLAHIEAVLRDAHRLGVHVGLEPDDLRGVLLAAWLHDIVYDTHAQDNEDRSAELAHAALRSCGIRESLVESCCRMIRATASHEASCLADAVLMDADLAILAAPADHYRRYARQIRAEYAWVPEPDYRSGRTEVLRNLLDRSRLFTAVDGWFDIDQARANVEAELRSL